MLGQGSGGGRTYLDIAVLSVEGSRGQECQLYVLSLIKNCGECSPSHPSFSVLECYGSAGAPMESKR